MDYTKPTAAPIVLGILSLVSVVTVFFSPVGLILGIIGTIMGSKARKASGDTGMVLSIIGLALNALVFFLVFVLLSLVLVVCLL